VTVAGQHKNADHAFIPYAP